MQRFIKNPYAGNPGYSCFGCSPDNDHGLHMQFYIEDETVYCRWEPKSYYQGYENVLHGGIQSTLMDEIASWTVYTLLQTAGVTSRMEIRYRKPVLLQNSPIELQATIANSNKRLASISVKLFDSTGTLCAQAVVEYFLFDPEKAKNEFNYPGIEAFID